MGGIGPRRQVGRSVRHMIRRRAGSDRQNVNSRLMPPTSPVRVVELLALGVESPNPSWYWSIHQGGIHSGKSSALMGRSSPSAETG